MILFFNNQEIFTVRLSKLSWSAFRGGGGGGRGGGRQDLSVSYLKQNCFSQGEGSDKAEMRENFSNLSLKHTSTLHSTFLS